MSDYQLFHGDCLEVLPTLSDKSINLAAVDFPYFGVKDNDWDNQWRTRDDFLRWIGVVCDQIQRLLTDNGSFYAFASPQMAWHVEGVIRERFNVLNRISWQKPYSRHNQSDKDILRCYFPQTEQIIFAENGDSDTIADDIAGFTEAETQLKRRIFGEYLISEFQRANVGRKQVAALFPSATGGLTGCVSNWAIGYNVPTPEQYSAIREYLCRVNGHADYLSTPYEDLRQQYEDLRRPFNATPDAPYTDVWTFPTVNTYPGKHPTEKPVEIFEQIVKLSSRPGDVVLDCCMGHGTCGIAAGRHGRRFIGMEQDEGYFRTAKLRIAAAYKDWDNARKVVVGKTDDYADMPLFATA